MLSPPSHGEGAPAATRAEILDLPSADGPGGGMATYDIANTSAKGSPAVLLEPGQPPLAGFEVRARVIVKSADAGLVFQAAAKHGVTALAADTSGASLANFWVLDAASISAAVEAATAMRADGRFEIVYVDVGHPIQDRSVPTDPLVAQQWHLINSVNPVADLNIEPAWNSGFTGTGVTIGILEGGWSLAHPDLASKHEADASQADQGFSSHGTSTAGLAGAVGNNSQGGAGVAFGSSLSRQYYFGADTGIATALTFRNDLNELKSNSWGPSDNGRAWTIGALTRQGLIDAAELGRGGLGTVLVWAGGNGRASGDRTDYDPYASDRRTICIGAISAADQVAAYSEPGSSLMVVAPSSGLLSGGPDTLIVTTSSTSSYTTAFGGTSAAAPIAAGVVALMLEANPTLSWRDVQHILIQTARRCNPAHPSWIQNSYGRWTSDDFGFGAIDAGAAVLAAVTWSNVNDEASWLSDVVPVGVAIPDGLTIANGGGITTSIVPARVMRIERAQVVITTDHADVGDLRIVLTSPGGTQSLLAAPRAATNPGTYGSGYTFTTTRSWDEPAQGAWTLQVVDESLGTVGSLTSWKLNLFGTAALCPSDWNLSGSVDLADLLDFFDAWTRGEAAFDATGGPGDGLIDLADLLDFFDLWSVHNGQTGACP